jgi:hypothetical protein
MKQIFVIFLSSVILLQSLSKLIIIADYEVNKDYISKILCENRNKPMMHCNGHCQLKKKLNKDEKQQQSSANPLKEKSEVHIFANYNSTLSPLSFLFLTESIPFNSSPNSSKHLLSVFHPPQC